MMAEVGTGATALEEGTGAGAGAAVGIPEGTAGGFPVEKPPVMVGAGRGSEAGVLSAGVEGADGSLVSPLS